MTASTRSLTLALSVLTLAGCFNLRDPLASTDAGMGTGGVGGSSANAGANGKDPMNAFQEADSSKGMAVGGSSADTGVTSYGGCEPVMVSDGVICKDPTGQDCLMYVSDSGPRACAPITWGCTDYGYGKIVCDPGGTMGVAGKGDPGMSAGGSAANSCDDGNACTYDGVLEDGTCYHKPSAGMGTDADSDGAPEGCDCEEHEANAFPGQTEYFSQPYKVTTVRMDSKPIYQLGDPAFDYDCNGWEELQYTAISSTCKSWENQPICLGEGWVVDPATKEIPVCGSGGAYQVCAWDANKNACLATTIMLLQGCR